MEGSTIVIAGVLDVIFSILSLLFSILLFFGKLEEKENTLRFLRGEETRS
jgi:Na+-transporting methylmalonyl-CoA/oxaloacetate decarboxylase gamma subunit